MTGAEIYMIIKFWGPIVSFFGLLYGAWRAIKKKMFTAVDSVLNNHLHGIEESSKQSAKAVSDLAEYHREMLGSIGRTCTNIETLSKDFAIHCAEDSRVQSYLMTELHDHRVADRSHYEAVQRQQSDILAGIEILKAKVD